MQYDVNGLSAYSIYFFDELTYQVHTSMLVLRTIDNKIIFFQGVAFFSFSSKVLEVFELIVNKHKFFEIRDKNGKIVIVFETSKILDFDESFYKRLTLSE